jgi:transcription elongation factor Elf1
LISTKFAYLWMDTNLSAPRITVIACPNCHTIQPVDVINTGTLIPCTTCGDPLRVDLFKAFLAPVEAGSAGSPVHLQGQAECFYHPGKQAVAPCAACGRLLCALCQVEFQGREYCLACMSAGRSARTMTTLEDQRVLYDSVALALAFWPMLFVFPTLVTAPAAIFVALRYWKRPLSILPRSRFRFLLALLLAGGQLVGWTVFFAGIVS